MSPLGWFCCWLNCGKLGNEKIPGIARDPAGEAGRKSSSGGCFLSCSQPWALPGGRCPFMRAEHQDRWLVSLEWSQWALHLRRHQRHEVTKVLPTQGTWTSVSTRGCLHSPRAFETKAGFRVSLNSAFWSQWEWWRTVLLTDFQKVILERLPVLSLSLLSYDFKTKPGCSLNWLILLEEGYFVRNSNIANGLICMFGFFPSLREIFWYQHKCLENSWALNAVLALSYSCALMGTYSFLWGKNSWSLQELTSLLR
jgi:hypothetical protein